MPSNKKKILIVEDDQAISAMYQTKLEAEGYEIIIAGSGGQALEIAKEKQVDLILLDIILPQLDGFSVLKEIKNGQKNKNTPIIMLTNLGTDEDRQKGKELGAADYLVKANLTPTQISEKIKKYLK